MVGIQLQCIVSRGRQQSWNSSDNLKHLIQDTGLKSNDANVSKRQLENDLKYNAELIIFNDTTQPIIKFQKRSHQT